MTLLLRFTDQLGFLHEYSLCSFRGGNDTDTYPDCVVLVEDGLLTPIDANFFLDPILEDGGAFALINHALSVSGFYINCVGDYSNGLDALSNSIVGNSHMDDDLQDAFEWWFALATESETEGLVVLLWLYELGFWPNSNELTLEAQSPETHESISFSKEDASLLLIFLRSLHNHWGKKPTVHIPNCWKSCDE